LGFGTKFGELSQPAKIVVKKRIERTGCLCCNFGWKLTENFKAKGCCSGKERSRANAELVSQMVFRAGANTEDVQQLFVVHRGLRCDGNGLKLTKGTGYPAGFGVKVEHGGFEMVVAKHRLQVATTKAPSCRACVAKAWRR
jgi:hypothetical protein